MVLFPALQLVEDTLHVFAVEPGAETVVQSRVQIELETMRGRPLGSVEAILADVPWHYLALFRKNVRSALPLHTFTFEEQSGRPNWASVEAVAATWVQEVLGFDTAGEYFSAVEGLDGEPLEEGDLEPVPTTPAVSQRFNPEVEHLHTKIAELEALIRSQAAATSAAPVPDRAGPQPFLFAKAASAKKLSASDFDRLQLAAGPPPKRLGRGEHLPPAQLGLPDQAEQVCAAEIEREVADPAEDMDWLGQDAQAVMSQVTDPIHRMMLLQLKQTNDLVQALVPKAQSQDPLSAVLSGPDSGSGSSTGVSCKGYAAREMFLKQLVDDKRLVATIQQHAMMELGIPADRVDGSLLRTFLEHRVPLADRKTLIQMGYMLAFAWEAGHRTGNIQMMAFAGRMMMYVEQCSLDDDRSNLGWLLTGLPEPNFQQLALNRRRTSLTPFSKLAPPTWVAANVSYLRDVELFETRLKTLGVGKASAAPAKDSDTEEKPRPKAKVKPKKGKAGGKGAEAPQSENPSA